MELKICCSLASPNLKVKQNCLKPILSGFYAHKDKIIGRRKRGTLHGSGDER